MDESRDIEQAKPKRKAKRAPRVFRNLRHRNARAQRAFLIAYAKTGNVSQAAKAARISRDTHAHWLHYEGPAGEAYRLAFAEAEEMAADLLEQEARRRAVEGVVQYRFTKDGHPLKHPKTGKPYVEFVYSDLLMRELLKGNRPAKYRDQPKEALSVEDVVTLVTALMAGIRAEVIAAIEDRARARALLSSIQAHVSRLLVMPEMPALDVTAADVADPVLAATAETPEAPR